MQGNIIEVCDVTFSNITLNFSEPQTVLGYTFWNSDSDGNRFQWRVESDGSSGAFASVNIPNTGSTPTSTGFQNIADFQQKLPLLVTELKIIYDGLGGLESVRLCRSPSTTPSDDGTTTGGVPFDDNDASTTPPLVPRCSGKPRQ